MEKFFKMSRLALTNITLSLQIFISDGYVEEIRPSASCVINVGSQTVYATVYLALDGTARAELWLEVYNLQLLKLLKPLLGSNLASRLSSVGLDTLAVDYLSLRVEFGSNQTLRATIYLDISSLKRFADHLISTNVVKQVQKIGGKHLEPLFGSLDMLNVSATIVLEAGKLSFALHAEPVIPAFGARLGLDLLAVNIGQGNASYNFKQLSVS